jgi:hypothetical protein
MSNRLTERAQTNAAGAAAVNITAIGGVAVTAAPKTDGMSAATPVLEVGARAEYFNGVSWDEGRSGFVGPVTGPFLGYQNTLPMGVFNAVAPVLADGQAVTLQFDANGQLKTSGGGGGASIGLVGAAVPASANYTGFIDAAGNLQGAHVYDVDTGAGVELVLGVNLRLAAGGGSVEVGTAAQPLRIDPTGTTTQPISAAALPLPAGAATEATLATRATEATLATRATEATLATRATEATVATLLLDATFTGRINTQGQKLMAGSTPVVIASDQSAIPVTNTPAQPANSAVTSVPSNLASVTLLAANANRKGAMITNDGTGNLYVKLGAVASVTSFTAKLIAGAYYEVPSPVYTGVIDGIWDVAVGSARVTETTP